MPRSGAFAASTGGRRRVGPARVAETRKLAAVSVRTRTLGIGARLFS